MQELKKKAKFKLFSPCQASIHGFREVCALTYRCDYLSFDWNESFLICSI